MIEAKTPDTQIRVYCVQKWKNYANWIPNHVIVDTPREADLILFEGGEDVSPSMYAENMGKYTSCNIERDIEEMDIFDMFPDKPKLGICRGSQLMCVAAGGRLVQHQENPKYIHNVKTFDGKIFPITSTHHQAQYPYDMPKGKYKVIAWTEGLSKHHLDGNNKEISAEPFKEVEIAYYPDINALAIQGHPESMYKKGNENSDTFKYLNDLLNKFLNKQL